VAWAEAYLHAKFHLGPSNRLATVHQRHRQDRQTDNGLIAWANRFTNVRPKWYTLSHLTINRNLYSQSSDISLHIHSNTIKSAFVTLRADTAYRRLCFQTAVAGMGDRLATIDMGRKVGNAVPFCGELGPRLTQCGLGR